MRYVSFIHRSKAGYGVSFPDFPGCVAVGDTVDDAIHLGSEVLAFHVEGLAEDGEAIPEPRTIEAIKADPELAEWRREADLVLIPLLLDRASLQERRYAPSEGGTPSIRGRRAQLDPNLALKDNHRLAPDAKAFTLDLDFHEARTAGTLE